MVVESGFVRDHEIGVTTRSLAQNIHGVEEGNRDSGDGSGWIARLDGIDGVGWQSGRVVLLDAMNGLGRGEGLCRGGKGEDCKYSDGEAS